MRNLSLLCDILGGNFQGNLITMLDLVLRASPPLISNYNYSRPPNTADLGTDEKVAVFGNRRYWESYITYKTLILDLEMGGGIGGRRYWEGRYSIGGDGIGGTTVVLQTGGLAWEAGAQVDDSGLRSRIGLHDTHLILLL